MTELKNNTFELVRLGDVKKDGSPDLSRILFTFPVPHERMHIRQSLRIDAGVAKGKSGSVKQAAGYEDTEIDIELTLVDIATWNDKQKAIEINSARAQYSELQRAFRDRAAPIVDGGKAPDATAAAVPRAFSIQSRLTDDCHIHTVLFRSLEVSDTPGEDTLVVRLSLIEFEPQTGPSERNAKKNATSAARSERASGAGSDESEAPPEDDPIAEEADDMHEATLGEEDEDAAARRKAKRDACAQCPAGV